MPVKPEVDRHLTVPVMVQSTTRNFLNAKRNCTLKSPGRRYFSDLDDGDSDGDDLGLGSSGC